MDSKAMDILRSHYAEMINVVIAVDRLWVSCVAIVRKMTNVHV